MQVLAQYVPGKCSGQQQVFFLVCEAGSRPRPTARSIADIVLVLSVQLCHTVLYFCVILFVSTVLAATSIWCLFGRVPTQVHETAGRVGGHVHEGVTTRGDREEVNEG